MIIEVLLDGEDEPRRYRVTRDDGTVTLRRRDIQDADEIVIDWTNPEEGVLSLLIDTRSYEIHVDEDEHDDERLVVHLLSHALAARASDARKRRVVKAEDGPDGMIQIVAPIPGRVVKVLATEGTAVQRGDGIIVLEAMKMENELKAPREGTVTRVEVEEGQGVEGGALLATIE